MSQRQKAKAVKSERVYFFLARSSALKAREGRSPPKNGGVTCSREGLLSSPASPASLPEDRPLIVVTMCQMMAEFSEGLQVNMKVQLHTLTCAKKCTTWAKERHKWSTKWMSSLRITTASRINCKRSTYKLKIADVEDHSQWNNLRIKGISDSVAATALNN
ncbi:Hypothetical predicted protein [Pelobates cultripes]|uniref:Uncharacterized protein n=1 Tax=Pelobates cultripes TaxID=61616 RepID=A0AAD1VJI8_PELCU|nr:Hypothetical predicted protein [Pelobates cultripes]